MQNSVSIIISTYNGKEKLSTTLDALSQLDFGGIDVELILVDNASTDGTFAFVEHYWRDQLNHPFSLVLLSESKPGKLYAQELGFSHAKGEYILICDDDNALFSDYLKIGVKYFNQYPEIGVIGGQGIAQSTIEIPEWFEAFSYHFACAPQAPYTGNVMPTRNVVYGAGMWVRKKAYMEAKQLGFQFLLNSRTGKSLTTGGEDSELCWAIKLLGYEIWYVAELKFIHHVPANRLTEDYRQRLVAGMQINAPLGWSYLRIWKNDIQQPVSYFWLKELAYSYKAIFIELFKKD